MLFCLMSWCDDTAAKTAGGSDRRGFPTPCSHSFPNNRLWSATGSKCHQQKCDSPSRVTVVTWVTNRVTV